MPAPKLSFDLQEEICALVREGMWPHVAARSCGLHHSTHYDWMRRGEAGESPYSEYSESIKTAKADSEKAIIGRIAKAGEGQEYTKRREIYKNGKLIEVVEETQMKSHWQANAWLAERLFEHWRIKSISVEDALKVVAEAIGNGNEDAVKQLRAAVAQAANTPSA